MLIHSPTTRIQDLGILRRDAACIMQRIILSCHSRDSAIVRMYANAASTSILRARSGASRGATGNVNRIGIDPARQIAAVREGELNWMIGVESTARQSIEVTQVRTGADGRFDVNRRFSDERSADRVGFKVFAVYSRSEPLTPARRNNISAARHWDHVDGAPAF